MKAIERKGQLFEELCCHLFRSLVLFLIVEIDIDGCSIGVTEIFYNDRP